MLSRDHAGIGSLQIPVRFTPSILVDDIGEARHGGLARTDPSGSRSISRAAARAASVLISENSEGEAVPRTSRRGR